MSDFGRKGLGDKLSEKATPQSSKSTVDKASEAVTNLGDSVSRNVVPSSEKSTTQNLSDKVTNSKHEAQHQAGHGGMLDSVKDTLGLNKH
ncbi:hypothetical protein LTR53_009588 [Teratosphaeriaceae sp. CCFEE 6253]|nr:hypothetical protein LTR53_009588 [Teratosphaeriaceae sp. CCFEE 6253]